MARGVRLLTVGVIVGVSRGGGGATAPFFVSLLRALRRRFVGNADVALRDGRHTVPFFETQPST
ncbi:hypothetical protein SSIG_07955 [Streptomyces filamentosus NRRL 11379]|nr:hypothetical protein SSIG_07955 [Streptomyces filamentosus NRRL 11379]